MKCVLCQYDILSGLTRLHQPIVNCHTCSINDKGKCDPDGCPAMTVYNKTAMLCDVCQLNIDGFLLVNLSYFLYLNSC